MTRYRFVSVLTFGKLIFAQSPTVVAFMGFPARRSINRIGTNETTVLEDKDSKEYMCMISRKSGRYYWSSRDNKEMTRHVSGAFVIFSADDGSGYVKAFPESKNLPLDYMEHLHDKLFTITYWGKHSTYKAD